MIRSESENGVKLQFESWYEFLDYCEKKDCEMPESSRSSMRDELGRRKLWSGTKTFGEAMELARDGWREPEEAVTVSARPFFDKLSSRVERENWEHGKEGASIDVAKYVENEPDCFLSPSPTYVEGTGNRVLRLTFNATVSNDVSKDAVRRKGVMALTLMNLLEYAGYRIEMDLVLSARASGRQFKYEVYVPIKKPDQPADLGRLLYCMCHASMTRRLYMSAMEMENATVRDYMEVGTMGTYGHPCDQSDMGDIQLPANVGYYSDNDIENWLLDQLEKCHVLLQPVA